MKQEILKQLRGKDWVQAGLGAEDAEHLKETPHQRVKLLKQVITVALDRVHDNGKTPSECDEYELDALDYFLQCGKVGGVNLTRADLENGRFVFINYPFWKGRTYFIFDQNVKNVGLAFPNWESIGDLTNGLKIKAVSFGRYTGFKAQMFLNESFPRDPKFVDITLADRFGRDVEQLIRFRIDIRLGYVIRPLFFNLACVDLGRSDIDPFDSRSISHGRA